VLRTAYGLGLGYTALCALLLGARPAPLGVTEQLGLPAPALPASAGQASGWFAGIRPRCNAVEIEVALRSTPPPSGAEGASYRAGCYALAGKIDGARQVIDELPSGWRPRAAGIVFEIVHPVADAGDDKSAGPMMRLVLDYWPENFQALYHAGMSEYAVDDHARARAHLRAFLELYKVDDGWTRNARAVLDRPEMRPNPAAP
jgi:hypothetical protein